MNWLIISFKSRTCGYKDVNIHLQDKQSSIFHHFIKISGSGQKFRYDIVQAFISSVSRCHPQETTILYSGGHIDEAFKSPAEWNN